MDIFSNILKLMYMPISDILCCMDYDNDKRIYLLVKQLRGISENI